MDRTLPRLPKGLEPSLFFRDGIYLVIQCVDERVVYQFRWDEVSVYPNQVNTYIKEDY
jgi:hypothetical protein